MKNCFFLLIFCASVVTASAQFNTPFTPRQTQAINALKARAIEDGYTNPQITGIATVKGSFPFGPVTIKNEFNLGSETNTSNDKNRGKAGFWAYLVRSEAKPDSLRAYVVFQVFTSFQVIDAPEGSVQPGTLPGDFTKNLPVNPDGSQRWMNSDSLVVRLRTNSTYQQYRQQRPDSTPDFVALGISKIPTPQFMAGEPLWSVTFSGNKSADFLSCSVHALDGRVECIQATVSVEEDAFKTPFAVAPNPAHTSFAVSIPEEIYSPAGVLEMYNTLGAKVYSFAMSNTGGGYRVIIPVENYPAGMYFVRYTSGTKTLTRPLIVE